MTNWFDVPQNEEIEFIELLRKQVFPKADENHWLVLNEMFTHLMDGYEEIPFERGFVIAQKHQIELLELLDVFGNKIISIDAPKIIRLRRLYKPFSSKSFAALRAARDYYETLRLLKLNQPDSYFTAKELMLKLKKTNHAPFIYLSHYLLDVELISPSNRSPEPTKVNAESVKYSLGIDGLYNFEKWYERKYLPLFGHIGLPNENIQGNGRLFGNKWRVISENIDQGGQSSVHVVKNESDPNSNKFALKMLNGYQRNDRFLAEISACEKLSHPNIIKLVDYSSLEDGGNPNERYLVTEYQEGGNLKKRAEVYKGLIDPILLVSKYLAEALDYSHSQGIIHRDVKPENILFKNLNNHDCVISDFGICLIEGTQRYSLPDEIVGPRVFMAPELETGDNSNVKPAVDVYSLGKVIYYMFSGGVLLPRERHREEQYNLFKSGGRQRLLGLLLDEMICLENDRIQTMDIVFLKLKEIEDWDKSKEPSPQISDAISSLVPSIEDEIKELLSDSSKKIKLDDFISRHIRHFLEKTDLRNFPAQTPPVTNQDFIDRINDYEKCLRDLQKIVILLAKWANKEQLTLLEKIFIRLAESDKSSAGTILWLDLEWYPLNVLIYTAGIVALSSKNYEVLAVVLQTPIQVDLEKNRQAIIIPVIKKMTKLFNSFKVLPGHDRHFVPMSEHLFEYLQPIIEDALLLGKSYEMFYDDFEILIALVYADLTNRSWGPPGRFAWKNQMGFGEDPFNRFVEEGIKKSEKWGPIQAGLFQGSKERFEKTAKEVKDLIPKFGFY